jgi:CRISPR-associated protein Csm4
MAEYLVRLRLLAPVATPFRSGTLFGHLCWAWRDLHGEEDLERWLRELTSQPFLLSDAFPADCLPRPLLRPRRYHPGKEAANHPAESKEIRKRAWVRAADFLAMRDGLNDRLLKERLSRDEETPETLREHRVAHNTIDRRTGTTPKRGGLFFMDEGWPGEPSADWDVYVSTILPPERLSALFEMCGKRGYGRDASLGRGQFQCRVAPAEDCLFRAPGNRLMSLSHGSLTPNMRTPRYRLATHYGKLGGLNATFGSPFKYPLTLLKPGATFEAAGGGPFGELLGDVHRHRPEVVENAWHLAVPYTEVE